MNFAKVGLLDHIIYSYIGVHRRPGCEETSLNTRSFLKWVHAIRNSAHMMVFVLLNPMQLLFQQYLRYCFIEPNATTLLAIPQILISAAICFIHHNNADNHSRTYA